MAAATAPGTVTSQDLDGLIGVDSHNHTHLALAP